MTTDHAKAQGLFIPNWWLSLLLIPVIGAALWINSSLNQIASDQRTAERGAIDSQALTKQSIDSLKDTLQYRLNEIERQGKLNDEHLRQAESRIARIEGKRGINVPDGGN